MTAPNTYRDRYQCPDWCIRDDHHDSQEPPEHYGPTFGRASDVAVTVTGLSGWLRASIWVEGDLLTAMGPAQARELAQHLLDAADWMANRR